MIECARQFKTCKFVRRVGALFAALCLTCTILLPFASASNFSDEADMPSLDDFKSHYGSWFVWRVFHNTNINSDYFELCASPVIRSGTSSFTLPYSQNFSTNAFTLAYIHNSEGAYYNFACAFPTPFMGASGYWSDLPSFPVGSGYLTGHAVVRCYSNSSLYRGFLSPVYSSSDKVFSYGNTSNSSSGSSTDTLDAGVFSSPFYSYPFAYRETSSSGGTGYGVVGGDGSFYTSSIDNTLYLDLTSTRLLVGSNSFVTPSAFYTISSSNLGFIAIKQPSDSPVYSAAAYNTTFSATFTLLVPVSMLPDVEVGDWISDSPEDLQDAITNEFGVDSGKLKDSKNSITDWFNSDSIDSAASDTALGFFGGIMASGLAPCFVVVALLCFGAIILYILLRKALD